MFLRIALFIMMAIGLAGLGTVAWIVARPAGGEASVSASAQPSGPRNALVAAGPLRAGSLVKPEDLIVKQMKSSDLPDGFTPDTQAARATLVGAMLKRAVGKDEPLLVRDVMRPTEHGFLAAVVGQGMRAVTIGVDAISGTAGLISPGDRVDVILSQSLEDPSIPFGRRVAAETVMSNARVVAIDQQIVQGDAIRANSTDRERSHTVTLEVSSEQAQRLTVAARIGRLSLSVRSAESGTASANTAGPAPIFASDVSRALSGQPAKAVPGVVRVYPGNGETREFRF